MTNNAMWKTVCVAGLMALALGCQTNGEERADATGAENTGEASAPESQPAKKGQPLVTPAGPGQAEATFAGGCFWCMEGPFEKLDGVIEVYSGYTGGTEKNPTYDEVARGRTSHVESVRVIYDPDKIGYEELVQRFWRTHDPTDGGGQFADRGPHYRPVIWYHDEDQKRIAQRSKEALEASKKFDEPIVVPLEPVGDFYVAEDYHQNYYKTNAVHYNAYREGSGRGPFLRRVWGSE